MTLSQDDVSAILEDAVSYELAPGASYRVSVDVAAHLGDRIDLQLRAGIGSLGRVGTAANVGGGLVFHWDKVVPAVQNTKTKKKRKKKKKKRKKK